MFIIVASPSCTLYLWGSLIVFCLSAAGVFGKSILAIIYIQSGNYQSKNCPTVNYS